MLARLLCCLLVATAGHSRAVFPFDVQTLSVLDTFASSVVSQRHRYIAWRWCLCSLASVVNAVWCGFDTPPSQPDVLAWPYHRSGDDGVPRHRTSIVHVPAPPLAVLTPPVLAFQVLFNLLIVRCTGATVRC